jgi:predicted nucleic acid-binding protein
LKRLKEKWAELLIIVIMIPALSWLLKVAWDLDSRMKAIETQLSSFAKNNAELRVGIAAAAIINQPFRAAIVFFQAVPENQDWRVNFEIWDTAEDEYSTFTAKLDTRRKQLLDASLVAVVKRTDLDALNFKEMQETARVVGLERPLPESIDQVDSFIVNADPKEIENELKSFGFKMIAMRPSKGIDTWPALRDELYQRFRGG